MTDLVLWYNISKRKAFRYEVTEELFNSKILVSTIGAKKNQYFSPTF